MSEGSSRGVTYCPPKAAWGDWEQEDASQQLSQLQNTLFAVIYPFTCCCS